MCGIAGLMHYKRDECVSFDTIHDMTQSLIHRGPDDEGYYIDPQQRVGLGHRRLSIIDVHSGKQPIANETGRMHIVFNGEIYNFPELRAQLLRSGHQFTTQTDTEVILHLYEEKGPAAFAMLNGIFAVAIYDESAQTIIIARDKFGVKPLYYADVDGTLLFGSELKAILASEEIDRELDVMALNTFLEYRFNPSPQTLFKHVHKLEPGFALRVRVGGTIRKFCVQEDRPRTLTNVSFDEALSEYDRLLTNAIQRQMLSDVPVGVLLSGGIDSAIIASKMVQHSSSRVNSYTIGFEGAGDFNELADARQTSNLLGTNHHEVVISQAEYLDLFEQSMYFLEEPIAMTTVPAMLAVSRFAARDLKVVLAGQGADEPLAGYARYRGEQFISEYGRYLRKIPFEKLTKFLPRNERLKRLAYAMSHTSEIDRFHAIHTIFQPELKRRLLLSDLHDHVIDDGQQFIERLHASTGGLHDSLSRLLYVDTRLNLADNLLLFNDKMSMAASLEMRVPFLDHELVAFLESMPSHFKIDGGVQKRLHKIACERALPHEIVHRKKRGFSTPMDQWLQRDFAKSVQHLFNERDAAVRSYFNVNTINQMILLHQTKRENYQRHLFALLSFELWHRNFFQKPAKKRQSSNERLLHLRPAVQS